MHAYSGLCDNYEVILTDAWWNNIRLLGFGRKLKNALTVQPRAASDLKSLFYKKDGVLVLKTNDLISCFENTLCIKMEIWTKIAIRSRLETPLSNIVRYIDFTKFCQDYKFNF